MSLIDNNLLSTLPGISCKSLPQPRNIKGLDKNPQASSQSATLSVYFLDKKGTTFARMTGEFHVMPQLDCEILFGNDIIVLEQMLIDPANKEVVIRACGDIKCPLRITPRKRITAHTVRCAIDTVIPPNTSCTLP